MTLQIDRAVQRGLRRVISRSGVVLLVLAIVAQLSTTLGQDAVYSLVVATVPSVGWPDLTPEIDILYQVGPGVAVALVVIVDLLWTVVHLAGSRLLARETSVLSTVPLTLFRRRFGRALMSGFGFTALASVGIICFVGIVIGVPLLFNRLGLAVLLGFIGVIPAMFVAVSLLFAYFAIAVDDDTVLAAVRRTWALTRGVRWGLFMLLIVASGFQMAGLFVGPMVSVALGPAGGAVQHVVLAAGWVAYYGLVADAYRQLRRAEAIEGEVADNPDVAAT
jgi:hypothetical protein